MRPSLRPTLQRYRLFRRWFARLLRVYTDAKRSFGFGFPTLFSFCCLLFRLSFLFSCVVLFRSVLPVGEKLIQYDTIAVNTIVKNKEGEVSSCDILYSDDLETFRQEYMKYTTQVAETSQDRDLSNDSMIIGTSAIVDTEIDGAVGMNSGI